MSGTTSPPASEKAMENAPTAVLVVLMLLMGGASAYFVWQNASISASYAGLQSSTSRIQQNLTALGSQLSTLQAEQAQLVSTRASLTNRAAELNSSLANSTQVLESLHSLSSRTVIVSDEVVVAAPSSAFSPAPVVSFTAPYPGYVLVTVVTSPDVGEMFLTVWSDPAMCNVDRLFCATSASPYFLGPGDTFLVPVLAGPVKIGVGNYNDYPVSASVTVVLYD